MYCTDFEYHNEKLSDYGMMICSFQGSGGIETASSGADLVFQQIQPGGAPAFHLASSNYESAYTTTFEICKNPRAAANPNDMYLTVKEISAIQRWLCRKKRYHKFKIYQGDYEHLYWNATFSSKQIQLDGQVIGMELTLYTDAPFAYLDEITIEKDCSAGSSFNVYDISDEEGFLYPDVTIQLLEGGTFTLDNTLSRQITKINNCSSGEIIKMNGKHQMITTSSVKHNTLSKDFNYVFPKIINTYENNKNTFTSSLKCKIIISYSPVRKIGL